MSVWLDIYPIPCAKYILETLGDQYVAFYRPTAKSGQSRKPIELQDNQSANRSMIDDIFAAKKQKFSTRREARTDLLLQPRRGHAESAGQRVISLFKRF